MKRFVVTFLDKGNNDIAQYTVAATDFNAAQYVGWCFFDGESLPREDVARIEIFISD